MTSAVGQALQPNSSTAAAAPSTRSSHAAASERSDATASCPSVAGSNALELCAELDQHFGAVDALAGGGLYPFLLDNLGAFLHALDELGRGFSDLDADPLLLLESRTIGCIPGFAGKPSQRLAGHRRDGVLILL